jgi:hypothetical protein
MSRRKKHVVYKAKKPLKALAAMPPGKETIIPAGSVLVWEHGDIAGELVSVSWLRQRVHLKQADLFMHCERITGDPNSLVEQWGG